MDLEHARRRVEEETARVNALIHEVRTELGGSGTDDADAPDSDEHRTESGSDTFEREKDFSILEELEAELAELEAALARIDDGTYGIDEVTGEPIDPERLEVLPAARANPDAEPRR
jgi:RNA polymerase-binding transcription factor DksA